MVCLEGRDRLPRPDEATKRHWLQLHCILGGVNELGEGEKTCEGLPALSCSFHMQ